MFYKKNEIEVQKYPHVERKLATAKEKGWVKINGVEIRDKVDICYQVGMQEAMLTTEADILFLGGNPGSGKSLIINELVCTPNGFVKNGDLKVGDVISGVDGKSQEILEIHDQGKLDTYRVFFNDGCHIDCSLDHLWQIDISDSEFGWCEPLWNVVPFIKIKEYLDKGGKPLRVPLTKEVEFNIYDDTDFTDGVDITNGIPDVIKYNSIECRSSVLESINFFDGHVSKELRNDARFIANSLGMAVVYDEECDRFINNDRYIVSYEYIGKEECRCIKVSNPDSLYIASENFIVTHNTYGILLTALQGVDKKGYSGLVIKKELVSTKDTAGGMLQDAKIVFEEFGDCQYRASDNPTFVYPTWGSAISFTHSNFESTTEKRVREAQERAKNFQCSFIAFDELTNFSFDNWWYWTSRNRDSSGMRSKMICTFNTNSHHFTRTMIDWYIGEDGYVIEDRIGKLRYFYKQGETERDFIWGDSKEEVIEKAGLTVRDDLKEAGIDPSTMVKSFTFMPSKMTDNRILINATEGGHVANIANMGGKERAKLFDANWNADTSGDAIVTREMIHNIFTNPISEDEAMYATLDVSGGGDNCMLIIWRGLRIIKILQFTGTSQDSSKIYKELADWLQPTLDSWGVPIEHLAFDATGVGQYLKSYTNGRPITSNGSVITEYDEYGNKVVIEQYFNLRSQLMGKMHYLLDSGLISCDVDMYEMFPHGKNKTPRELIEILCDEANVFMRTTKGNGKFYFRLKDEFKKAYHYSPDFMDCIIYRAIFELDQSKRKEIEEEFTEYDYEF